MYGKQTFASKVEAISSFTDSLVDSSSWTMGCGTVDLIDSPYNFGSVIKQIQSQSKYQFFYNDKLSTITVEPLKVKDVSLEEVLNTLLKNKDISYKIEENIIYLSEKGVPAPTQQPTGKERTITGRVLEC